MKINELLQKINGMSNAEQAAAIANYMATEARKKTVENARRDTRCKCFAGMTKKLTKAQQESLLYEFLNANANVVNQWLRKQHSDMFMVNYKKVN